MASSAPKAVKGPLARQKAHVVGAGLAGLAAAVRLAQAGVEVELSDAAAQAGGRCRSYFDPHLDAVIDNGNHLVMSGNQAVARYLALIGAEGRLSGPESAAFDFVDVSSNERWTVRPNAGPLPWWIFDPSRRPPGTRARDFLPLARLLSPGAGQTVADAVPPQGAVWDRLMQPFLLAALNTRPERSSAILAGAIVRETLARGGDAYRPRIAEPTLSAAFVDPALAFLEASGGRTRLGRRLRRLELAARGPAGLVFSDTQGEPCRSDAVILAVPPWTAKELVPSISAPDEFRAIVNGHFKVRTPKGAAAMTGVIGGAAEWIFVFEERIGVTVSDADALVDLDRAVLAERLWADVARVHGLPPEPPPWQIIKEKRATFAATLEQDAKRPPVKTDFESLFLAGDWTQTGLPGTIEGALRSGFAAADLAIRRLKR